MSIRQRTWAAALAPGDGTRLAAPTIDANGDAVPVAWLLFRTLVLLPAIMALVIAAAFWLLVRAAVSAAYAGLVRSPQKIPAARIDLTTEAVRS